MAKMQEEMNQHAHVTNPILVAHPTVIENLVPPPLVHILVGPLGGVPPAVLNPFVIQIDDQQDNFFSPMVASMNEAFGSPANKAEKKVKVVEEKLKVMESTKVLGLDASEMCLVSGA